MKKIHGILSGVLFLSMTALMPMTVNAEINSAEQRILSVVDATYTYNGVDYKITDSWRAQVYAYLDRDDVNMTDAEVTEYISIFYDNIGAAVSGGYMQPVSQPTPQPEVTPEPEVVPEPVVVPEPEVVVPEVAPQVTPEPEAVKATVEEPETEAIEESVEEAEPEVIEEPVVEPEPEVIEEPVEEPEVEESVVDYSEEEPVKEGVNPMGIFGVIVGAAVLIGGVVLVVNKRKKDGR